MDEIESRALRIGGWVVCTGLGMRLGRPVLDTEDPTAVVEGWAVGMIDRRRLAREFDEVADIVAERLIELVEESPYGVWRTLVDADRCLRPSAWRAGLDQANATELFRLVRDTEPGSPARDGVLWASCLAVFALASRLPQPSSPDMVPPRSGSLAAAVAEAMTQGRETFVDVAGPNPAYDSLDERYRRFVADTLDRLEMTGLAWGSAARVPLTEGFVEPTVWATADDSAAPRLLSEAMTDRRRMLILGEPGSGKSTLARWLAVRLVRHTPSGTDAPVPLLVRLAEAAHPPSDPLRMLTDGLVRPADVPAPTDWIRRLLSKDSTLLLIDGVDEVPVQDRAGAWRLIGELADAYPAPRMVVTARPGVVGTVDDRFDTVQLQPMNRADVAEFVRRWHRLAGRYGDASGHEEDLLGTIDASPHLTRLMTSPLMCSLLCAVTARRATALPRTHEVYKAALDMLLERSWSERRAPGVPLARSQQRTLLAQVAYWFLRHRYVEADRKAVVGSIADVLSNMPDVSASAAEVLDTLVDTSGVLRESVPGRIDFVHRTFQEYLAARAVLDQDALPLLVPRAHEAGWGDVLAMAAAQAPLAHCQRLVGDVLHRAEGDDQHRTRLLEVARDCLAERAEARSAPLRSLYERVARLGSGGPSPTRRLVVAVDIERFTARTEPYQLTLMGALHSMLRRAFVRSGVPLESCAVHDRGDGALILVPDTVDVPRLVRGLPSELCAVLRQHNARRSAEGRMRLRMAVSEGHVVTSDVGYVGQAVVVAARLLDSHAARHALRASDGLLVAVLTDDVHGLTQSGTGRFEPCVVHDKSLDGVRAWARVYGSPDDQPPLADLDRAPVPSGTTIGSVALVRDDVDRRAQAVPPQDMAARAAAATPPRDVRSVLASSGITVVAELTRDSDGGSESDASPGSVIGLVVAPGLSSLARRFEAVGAPLLAVQMGPRWRDDCLADLRTVRDAVLVPVLCQGLILSEYQILEARALGADAAELPVAALSPPELSALTERITALGMTPIARVGTVRDCDRAIEAGADVFTISAPVRGALAPPREDIVDLMNELPPTALRIVEGRPGVVDDILYFADAGADAVVADCARLEPLRPWAPLRQMIEAGSDLWSHRSP
ncbi:NACHT domain-containing protein [Micromonospora sp. LOL_015]|uniref:NACHT domain-containing protein n=1 Tax=Micromonospora sp. LOL_015 TaxID=3345416 RepID=UPI003A8585B4